MKTFLFSVLMLASIHANADHFLVAQPDVPRIDISTSPAVCRGMVKEVHVEAYTVRSVSFDGDGCDTKSKYGKIVASIKVQRNNSPYPDAIEFVTSDSDADMRGGLTELLTFAEKNNDEFSSMWESALLKEEKESQNKGY